MGAPPWPRSRSLSSSACSLARVTSTRLRKLDDGQYDAIVLASAGLERMDLAGRITHRFTPDEMLPAVAQGIIAAECRAGDAHTRELLAGVDDAATRAAAAAERAFLRGLGGGCQLPIAAFAELHGSELHVRGLVAQPDGVRIVRAALSGEAAQAASLGARLAEQVLASGARELMEAFDARSSA